MVVIPPLCDEDFVYIPTAFTPNEDSKNDQWGVFSTAVDEMLLIVYDRWGNKVFESTEVTNKWDGMNSKGLPYPSDVYGWHCRYTCFGGLSFEQKGNVTLLR